MKTNELEQLNALYQAWLIEEQPNGPARVSPTHKRIGEKIAEDAGREKALWDASESGACIGELLLVVESSFYCTADGENIRYWIKNYKDDIFGPYVFHEITSLPNWQKWVQKMNMRLFELNQESGKLDG